mgnify:CR=1 FL=1
MRISLVAIALSGVLASVTGCVQAAPRHHVDARVVVVSTRPPPLRHVHHVAVRPGYVWASGYWRWNGHRHVWVDGRWLPARPGYVYLAPHWRSVRHGWRFVPGHWARR